MGKDVSFKCIDLNCPHSDDKICMKWEYEPEEDDKYLQILDKLNVDYQFKIDYTIVWDTFKAKKICDRCTWFFQGGDKSTMLLGSFGIHHSYSNPVLMSDWFIDKFIWGVQLAREYDRSHGPCNRLTLKDIKRIRQDIDALGKPIRDSDKEARDEAVSALDWAESMFELHKDKQIDLLYFGEF